jgi:hypothetical protein
MIWAISASAHYGTRPGVQEEFTLSHAFFHELGNSTAGGAFHSISASAYKMLQLTSETHLKLRVHSTCHNQIAAYASKPSCPAIAETSTTEIP